MKTGETRKTSLPKFTNRLSLGSEALQVSPFCLGMVGEEDTILAAFDSGINFFFLTADMHWPLYEGTRRGLQKLLARGGGIRDQIVVSVVSYVTQPEFCWMPFAETLRAVPGLERIDLSILGGVYAHEFLVRLRIYQEHRRNQYLGIRTTGATFHDRHAACVALANSMIDISYIRYNPSHPGAREDVFPYISSQRSTLLYNFKSTFGAMTEAKLAELGLEPDLWRPNITDYYRFALTRSEFDGTLCGFQNSVQLGALEKALHQGPLEEEEEQYLVNLADLAEGRATLSPTSLP